MFDVLFETGRMCTLAEQAKSNADRANDPVKKKKYKEVAQGDMQKWLSVYSHWMDPEITGVEIGDWRVCKPKTDTNEDPQKSKIVTIEAIKTWRDIEEGNLDINSN